MILKIFLFITLFMLHQSSAIETLRARDFSLTWSDAGDSTDFVLTSRVQSPNNVWIALGLSNDNQMGNDDVVVCKIFNGKGIVERYFTTGHRRPDLLFPNNPSIGISKARVTLENGLLTCSFTRLKSLPGIRNYYNLYNRSYYLLFARGNLDRTGLLQYHGNTKVAMQSAKQFS